MSISTELVLQIFLVVFLLPIVIHSLLKGSPAPADGPFAKYMRAVKHLPLCNDLFLLLLCALSLGRVLTHYGLIGARADEMLAYVFGGPFVILCFAMLGLWTRALLKVRRGDNASA